MRIKLQDECFRNYISKIPRYGCIIFNPQLDKVLFCVFHKYNRGGIKKRNVVLPKGKIDEGESELESAIREVQEETHLKISP